MTEAVADAEEARGALRASSVVRRFTGIQALRGVTLALHAHEVVGLIGPNGAGKSTLVNVLSGFDLPTSGTVELDGMAITRWSPQRRARAGIARTFQHSRSFRGLTVRENIEVSALGAGARPPEARVLTSELIYRLGLNENAVAGALPHGHERLLGVARALAIRPSFVLLDEPGAGLPEAEVRDLAEVVTAIVDDFGVGVLLIDHNMALIMEVCHRIHVLDQGATIAEGTPAEIRANLDVTAAYLGESALAEAS